MTNTPFRIYFTCDADPDQATLPTTDRTNVTWNGIELLSELFSYLNDQSIRLTLFLRADDQIRMVFNKSTHWIERLTQIFSTEFKYHEWAWHPHLYKMKEHRLYPIQDPSEALSQIKVVHEELRRIECHPTSVRMGEAWHCNEIMSYFDQSGFTVDSSAIPGRKRKDEFRSFDWEITPNGPYYPSLDDYRISGPSRFKLLEMPMTTALTTTCYDSKPKRRYLNPTYHPQFFAQALNSTIQELGAARINDLVFIFHTGELLEQKANDLHAYGMNTFKYNVSYAINSLKESFFNIETLTLNQRFLYV
jgi:hypothetical protein